jgi:hypothetical protein
MITEDNNSNIMMNLNHDLNKVADELEVLKRMLYDE